VERCLTDGEVRHLVAARASTRELGAFHPVTGGVREAAPFPDEPLFPPLEEALFLRVDVEAIEAELGLRTPGGAAEPVQHSAEGKQIGRPAHDELREKAKSGLRLFHDRTRGWSKDPRKTLRYLITTPDFLTTAFGQDKYEAGVVKANELGVSKLEGENWAKHYGKSWKNMQNELRDTFKELRAEDAKRSAQ
jgi:hypothetical protein